MRKGEKINEDLYYDNRNFVKTSNPDIFFEKYDELDVVINDVVEDIKKILINNDPVLLKEFVSKYLVV